MMTDAWGVPVSTDNAESLAGYARAVRSLNCYRGDPVAIIDEALAADPDFAMGHVLRAHVHVSMWEKSVLPAIETSLARLGDLDNRMNDRERQHAAVIRRWADGDWEGYKHQLDRLNADYPRDLLALQLGHLSDFYHGDRENLRGRVGRALPSWTRDDPGYGFLLGMQAFGHEECGSYALAEETGRHAIAVEPDDCWGQHAVAHVMEMQGRQAEGIAFMESRRDHWAQDDNAFAFHNWWHTAIYNLDQDRIDRVLEIYDQGIRPEPSEIQLLMVDAVALLWRLHLRGIDVGDRWHELVATYERTHEPGFYVFNDMHAMMAYVATSRTDDARSLLRAVDAAGDDGGTNAMMTRAVGGKIVHAIWAFGQEDYAAAVDLLMPVRFRANTFGGSHAQRDIIHRTVIEAAMRAGDNSLATALANERIAIKPHCPFNWRLHARATAMQA